LDSRKILRKISISAALLLETEAICGPNYIDGKYTIMPIIGANTRCIYIQLLHFEISAAQMPLWWKIEAKFAAPSLRSLNNIVLPYSLVNAMVNSTKRVSSITFALYSLL